MAFNENSRVKIPTILNLVRLGYKYLSLKNQHWDETTNIFTDIFQQSIKRLNPTFNDTDVKRLYDEFSLCLENEDLGKAFYEKITATSGVRVLDFENFNNNSNNYFQRLAF
jgi:type I restriction enzyme R subunit